jgi:hypothetical protein
MNLRGPLALLVTTCVIPAAASAQSPPVSRVTLEDIGVLGSFGLRDRSAVQWSALTGALDAAFVGNRVAVLNATAPWIRIYDATDSLVATAMPNGIGPGQTRAYSISSTPSGDLWVSHRRGIERISGEGASLGSLPGDWPDAQVIGAAEACGGDPVLLVERMPDFDGTSPGTSITATTTLVRMRLDEEVRDTLASFAATHLEPRSHHPWLVDVREDRLLVYTEESAAERLGEITCDGDVLRQTPVDAVSHARAVRTAEGMSVRVPGPPFAAGLVRLDETVLWATREVVSEDSVTVVTALEDGAPSRRLEIEGWFKLFDVAPDGSVLVGNAWALGLNREVQMSWRGPAAVFRVDGGHLLRLMEERGTPVGP